MDECGGNCPGSSGEIEIPIDPNFKRRFSYAIILSVILILSAIVTAGLLGGEDETETATGTVTRSDQFNETEFRIYTLPFNPGLISVEAELVWEAEAGNSFYFVMEMNGTDGNADSDTDGGSVHPLKCLISIDDATDVLTFWNITVELLDITGSGGSTWKNSTLTVNYEYEVRIEID